MGKTVMVALVVAGAVLSAIPSEAQVSVNVNIGPPPVIFAAPPRVVVVPQTPVYYAPDTSYNVFVYEGRYYSFHNGAWFLATSYGGPWAFVPVEHVPRPVVLVPVRYYKIPPGQARKMARWDRDGDRDHDRNDDRDDDRGRGHGRGHGKHDR
jgi:hypothetical protein